MPTVEQPENNTAEYTHSRSMAPEISDCDGIVVFQPAWDVQHDRTGAMSASSPSSTKIGVLCAIGAATAFSFNDMAIKFLSGDYPLHQIVFVRATIGLILTCVVFAQLEGGLKLRTKNPFLHMLANFWK